MVPQKIIFTGITGLLGGYFLKQADSKHHEVIGIGNRNVQYPSDKLFSIDITDRNKIQNLIKKIRPEIIIHAASIGNVDYCEKHPEEAYRINVLGTKHIIDGAKKVNAKIIFISSNAVYDGDNPPYDESSPRIPIDVYGKTKVKAEDLVSKSGLDITILRLMTMYGWPPLGGRTNPVVWVIDSLKKGEQIKVVNDIYNNHLYGGEAAKVIWQVIKDKKYNTVYNVAGLDSISRYDLALKTAKIFNLNPKLISPVDSSFFKDLAKRPKNTTFNTKKMEEELGIKPLKIDEGLRLMRQEQMDKLVKPL